MSALTGIRILELAEGVGGEYCGKLLADFGATVIKVEPPGGSPTRALGPFVGKRRGPERSGLFAYLNTGKQSVSLELATDAGCDAQPHATAHAGTDGNGRGTQEAGGPPATPVRILRSVLLSTFAGAHMARATRVSAQETS